MIVRYTRHAEQRIVERGIRRAWVEATIADPSVVEADPQNGDAVHAFRAIADNGGRSLRVVYVPDAGSVRVITAVFDRGRKP